MIHQKAPNQVSKDAHNNQQEIWFIMKTYDDTGRSHCKGSHQHTNESRCLLSREQLYADHCQKLRTSETSKLGYDSLLE